MTSAAKDPIRISDVLPKVRAINTYASLTRDFESSRGQLSDPSKNVTVLAPRNKAVHDMPHKPWEDPEEYRALGEAEAYQGTEGQERARRNLEKFVEGHILPVCPWGEGEEVTSLGGRKFTWVSEGDRKVVSLSMEHGYVRIWMDIDCIDSTGKYRG